MIWRLRSRREPGQNSGCCLEFWEVDAAPVQRDRAPEQIHGLAIGDDVEQAFHLLKIHHRIDAARLDQRRGHRFHVSADGPVHIVIRTGRVLLLKVPELLPGESSEPEEMCVLADLREDLLQLLGNDPGGPSGRERVGLITLMSLGELALQVLTGSEKITTQTERNVRLRETHALDQLVGIGHATIALVSGAVWLNSWLMNVCGSLSFGGWSF